MRKEKFERNVGVSLLLVLIVMLFLVVRASAKPVNPNSPSFATRTVRTSKVEVLRAIENPVIVEPIIPTRDPESPYTIIEIPCGPEQDLICTSRGGGR